MILISYFSCAAHQVVDSTLRVVLEAAPLGRTLIIFHYPVKIVYYTLIAFVNYYYYLVIEKTQIDEMSHCGPS